VAIKIFPQAKSRILEIWDYTAERWSDNQADKYVRSLVETIKLLPEVQHRWRSVNDQGLQGTFYVRHAHHYIFFRKFSNGSLGVISVLHENMDIPARLKVDAATMSDDDRRNK
jgi:toxin ParE1/3/4